MIVELFFTVAAHHAPVHASRGAQRRPLGWDSVAQCESGNDWHADTGNGYFGGVQFDQDTWDAYHGRDFAPRADLASKSEQIVVAERLYRARGTSPWPVCGRYLEDAA